MKRLEIPKDLVLMLMASLVRGALIRRAWWRRMFGR